MKRKSLLLSVLSIACFAIVLPGCENGKSPDTTAQAGNDDHGHDHDDDSHGHSHDDGSHDDASHDDAHGHESSRGGQIIDLGRDGQYHAEVVDNHDDESISVFVLDANLEDLKIDAETISLMLSRGDDVETFELAAGEGSSFKIANPNAFELMEAEGAEGKLRVTIDGKPFTGSFQHQHDH